MDKGTEMLSGHMAIVVEAFRGATVEVDGHELPVTLEKILADDAGFRAAEFSQQKSNNESKTSS